MEELTLAKIVERNMKGEELNSMWYLRAIETAICALSKCPAACDELLYQLEQAYSAVNDECEDKICAEEKDNVPSPNAVIAAMVPAALEELHSVAPKLKAEDLTAAIIKGFQAAGLIERVRNTETNLSDRADLQEACNE